MSRLDQWKARGRALFLLPSFRRGGAALPEVGACLMSACAPPCAPRRRRCCSARRSAASRRRRTSPRGAGRAVASAGGGNGSRAGGSATMYCYSLSAGDERRTLPDARYTGSGDADAIGVSSQQWPVRQHIIGEEIPATAAGRPHAVAMGAVPVEGMHGGAPARSRLPCCQHHTFCVDERDAACMVWGKAPLSGCWRPPPPPPCLLAIVWRAAERLLLAGLKRS